MLRFVVLVMFAATAVNAGFYRHRHLTIDMNGFHNLGHHGHGFGQHGRFGPPSPMFGPPPPFGPQFHHGHHHGHQHGYHHHHHQHVPQCNHKPGDGFGTFPFPNIPSSTDTMPFIPNMNNPFIHGSNFPFNPQNPFLNGGNIPSNFGQNNFGFDPMNNPSNSPCNANTISPVDANTALEDQSSTTPSTFDVDDSGNQPQNPHTSPNQTNGMTFCDNFRHFITLFDLDSTPHAFTYILC